MKRKISVALESPFVARWFFDTLIEYGRSRDVQVSFYLLRQAKENRIKKTLFAWSNGWINKRFPFFELVNCNRFMKDESLQPDVSVLGAVSSKSVAEVAGAFPENPSWFLGPKGHLLTKPGIRGLWYFYLNFFSLGWPLTLQKGSQGELLGVYFQTRNFSFRKNVGFLQFNLEKILDQLVFDVSRPLTPLESGKGQGTYLSRVMKFQFWQLSQKFKENLLKPRWHLMTMSIQSLGDLTGRNVAVIKPPASQAWADPMLVDTDKGLFLFFEEIEAGKGHLSVVELDRVTLQMITPPAKVLNSATHLSYPFVFKVENEWYMLPENSSAMEVVIYKADQFPLKWSRFREVFRNQRWVDLTPFYYQKKWWIFGVKKETSYASSYQELHLFYCNDLLRDEWVSHPQNPVVSDVRHARPAGPLFFEDGKLMRPAQNCFNSYGGGLVLCEVTRMTETHYSEQVRGEFHFSSGKRVSSFHTMGVYEQWIMGDCFI